MPVLKSTITGLWRGLHGLLAPPHCMLCGSAGLPGLLDICDLCLVRLPRCEPGAIATPRGASLLCCPWAYAFPVDAMVLALKFRGERAYARLFGTLLARERLAAPAPLPDCVLPVPLHARRLRERGYNQAAELARYAAAPLGLPLELRRLWRTRATREQTSLRSAARAANVDRAFTAAAALQGRHVALVDDVTTTGSTLAAATAALLEAGAAGVELWVIAHASLQRSRRGDGPPPGSRAAQRRAA